MASLKTLFKMEELTLSTSFRCPEAVVKHVQWRAPHMVAWEDNPTKGTVTHLPFWRLDNLPSECAVICRNNAPLLTLAIAILKAGRYPNLWGNDVAKGLVKEMKDFGAGSMSQADVFTAIDHWHHTKAQRARNLNNLNDRAECMRIFAKEGDNLREIIANAEQLFLSEGKLDLMTGHKAKGHEWDDVFILDAGLIGTEGQEPNLRYVMATRSKNNLTYINTADCAEIIEAQAGKEEE